MATIQRTFKDPTLQNPLKYLGYDSIPVEIEDSGISEDYFNVEGIGQQLHAGKNLFFIKPDPETLVNNAEIGVEVLDADGDLVPVRLLDNRRNDGSIGLVIEVDETRPKGYGQVSIVSVAKGKVVNARLLPVRNPGVFNIRWAKRVYINRDAANTSEITYITPPKIEVAELKLPYYQHYFNTKLTSSLSSALTSANPIVENEITCSIYQLSSSYNTNAKISYEKRGEQIYLELSSSDFGGFVSDMENGTIFFNGSNIVGITPAASPLNNSVEDGDGLDDIISEGSYFTSIQQVLSPSRVLVSSPHTTFQGTGNQLQEIMHQEFQHSDFTLTWAMPPYSHSRYPHPDPAESESMWKTSYAGIIVDDLDPYSGEVHRIKTYIRAESRPDDYELCSDLPVEAQEMLVVSMSPHYNKNRFKNIPCGKFDRLNSSVDSSDIRYFGHYWNTSAKGLNAPTLSIVSESLAFPTVEQPPNIVHDFIPMRPSLRVGTLGEVSPLDDNVGRNPSVQPLKVAELHSNISASFKKDKVYVLEVSAFVKGRDLIEQGASRGVGTSAVDSTLNTFAIQGGEILTPPRLDIFGTGDAFQDDTNRSLGKLIGEINDVNQPKGRVVDIKKVDGYSGVDHILEVNFRFPFKADADAIGEFRFEIERGLWYFQEISVKPFERAGVTTHNYNYLVPLPRGLSHPDRRDIFDFMFEFYNIEGHMCTEKVYIDNVCMDNDWTIAPTGISVENFNSTGILNFTGSNSITSLTSITASYSLTSSTIIGPLYANNITNVTSSVINDTDITNITNNFGDILVYNTSSQEVGHVKLGCALDYMDSENCCCHLHADTNIYIFIDNTSMAVAASNPDGGAAAQYTPGLLTRWVVTKFEKDMRERYPYWKGNIFVGQGSNGPAPGTLPAERWLSMMSWPAVGNQNQLGPGSGITGSMSSVKWGSYPYGTSANDESTGAYIGSDNFVAHGYSASAYYLENSPIMQDGVPDRNVIVFTMVDETDPGTNIYHGGGAGNGYHYRHNDSSTNSAGTSPTGTSADFNNHLTSHYKADYGLFVGKAHPEYTCFSGYLYALPSSNNTTHPARQHFALHAYAAIETDVVDPANYVEFSPTQAKLHAITGSNPYANAANSVGTNSPHYQGGIYGLKSQSIKEKHDFVGGISGWYSSSLSYPVSLANANKSGSWLRGQASFSADLFDFINGDSIGVKVDGTTICVNESNELFAAHTGSYTGSFTGDIITNNITINEGGINTYILGDTFVINNTNTNIFGGDTIIRNLTVNNIDIDNITNIDNSTTSVTNEYNHIVVYNTASQDLAELKLGCAIGFMDSENCCCHLHADTNIYIFIDNTSLVFSGSAGDSAAMITRYMVPKFEKDMRERYSYWKGNIYVGEGTAAPAAGTNMSERWLSWMSWPAVGNQNQLGAGTGITGSMKSVKWEDSGSETNHTLGTYTASDAYTAYGYSASAYYLENSPISASSTVDGNVIVFTIVDETETDYHNKVIPQGTDSDWSGQPTDNYKRDYGLFVGEAYPQYDCFSGYVYALPRSTGITAGARQKFALHVYGAIETSAVSPSNFVGFTPTGANLSAITGSNPYANASSSVGTLSPHYQGGIYGLKSQSIYEKHNFAQGAATWTSTETGNIYPHYQLNSTASWTTGQKSFSADLFNFIDGDSIGVRVDAKTICVNEGNELFAKTGSMNVSSSDSSISASYAATSSHAIFANTSLTASYALSASHEITYELSSSRAETASYALGGDGNFSGSFTGSFDGDARLTGSFTGSFDGDGSGLTGVTGEWDGTLAGDAQITGSLVLTANLTASNNVSVSGDIEVRNVTASGQISASGGFVGDLIGTASYGADNDWYKQGVSDALTDPTISDQIYHTGRVGVGDFSSNSVTHQFQVEGNSRIGNSTGNIHSITGSLNVSHSTMQVFTGSGKLAFGLENSNALFTEASTRVAQFYSASAKGVFLNVTNWETASQYIIDGGIPGGSSPSTNGPRSGISVNALNSSASYGYGGTRGTAGGSISYHPDTYEGGATGDDLGDGGDTDAGGRRLLQEVLHITTGGNPQGSINIHARGDRGQEIRFFTGNDDTRNTGGQSVETQRMTIAHEGGVGIGTHDPQRRLHVSNSISHNTSEPIVRFEDLPVYPSTVPVNMVIVDSLGDLYQMDSNTPLGTVNQFDITNLTSSNIFVTNITASTITASFANINDGNFTGSFSGSFTGISNTTGSFSGSGFIASASNSATTTNVLVSNDTGDEYHPITFIDDTSPDGSAESLKANANITVNPADASLTLAQITASNNISASGYVYSNQIALNPDSATQAAIQTGILNGDYSLFVGSGSSNTSTLIYSDTGHASLQLRSNTGANAQVIFNEDGSARYIIGHKGSDDSFQIRNSSFMTGGDELFNLAFDGSGLKLGHDANFHVTASGNISTSADIYFKEAFGASAVYHDNDANTGIKFNSDTIEIKENGQQSAKFATTGGNSIGNSLYMTSITGSSITLGKSSAEHVTASADLWFQTDDSKILFGADKDIKLSHTADRGLTISNTGNLGAGSAESASSLLGLTLHNDTTTIAAGDYIGGLFYTADSNATYNNQTYVSLVAQVQSTSETRESANLYINVVHDGFDGGDAANQPAVSIKGGQNQIINHLGTKHEQLTTLSSSNNLPLILSKLKSIPTYTDFLTYDSGSGYVYKQGRDNVSFGSTTGGIGTFTIGVTFMIGPIVNITNNTLITNNFTTTGTGNLTGDVTLGTDCDNFLHIKSKVTASCIISSSEDIIAKDVDFRNITGSGNIQIENTAPENYFFGAINVRHNDRTAQSNINATPMGDDVSIFEGSLIVGERANQNGIPNNAIINGAESLIVGQGNAVTNQNARSIVMGYFNSGSGLANFVGGSAGNKGLSDVTMVYGYGNHNEDNDGGIVLGSYNHISATSTNGHHAIGTQLVNSGSKGGSIVLGMNNAHGVTDAVFTIGDGHAYNKRRDLLVARSGSIQVFGNITGSGGANPTNISIDGTLEAAVKSFVIPHPTKTGKKLKYGVLEGPEHAVYYRGKTTGSIIELPEEWTGLVDEETITVQLTSIGSHQNLYVNEIKNNSIFIKNKNIFSSKINAYYLVHGTRKDINPLETTV